MDQLFVLLCKVRDRFFALPLTHVIETMRPQPVEPLAGTPPFVQGLSLIRGSPTPIVDAALLLGEASSKGVRRFVTVRSGVRHFALAVDEVLGVRGLYPSSLEALAPLMGPENGALVASVGKLDAALLLVLNTIRIVSSTTWAAIDGRGGR